MNGNGPSPGASSSAPTGERPFSDEGERRHLELASDLARVQDVSAWPAVCAAKTALGTCCRWVLQHADAFLQEEHLLDGRMQDHSLAAEFCLKKEPAKNKRQQQDAHEKIAVRGSRQPVHPATWSDFALHGSACCSGQQGASVTAQRVGHMTRC